MSDENDRRFKKLLDELKIKNRLIERLYRSEEELKKSLFNIQKIDYRVDTEGKIIWMSPAFEKMFGYSLEEVIGTSMADYYRYPENRKVFLKLLADGNGEINNFETEILHKAGHVIWVSTYAKQIKTVDGTVIGVEGETREVTSRKLAELKLVESEERYRSLVDFLPYGIVVHRDGFVVYANPSAMRTLGARRVEQLLGKKVLELVAEESRPLVIERMKRLINDRASVSLINEKFMRLDGRLVDVEVAATPIMYANKKSAMVAFRNITDRLESEKKIREIEQSMFHAQKLESLGLLAGGVAHDFNNLLTTMMGNADLALIAVSTGESVHEAITDIKNAVERAAELAEQMLAYSGKGKLVVEVCNINDLVGQIVKLLESTHHKNCQIKYCLAKNLPAIEVDATQLRQVIMNLVTNAAEAIGEGAGIIKISTTSRAYTSAELSGASSYLREVPKEGEYVILQVEDDGCGMSKEILKKLFDPFFTTKFTGRGLGMSAVMGIIRGHGGAIHTQSEAGRGTTFSVMLPASDKKHKTNISTARQDTAGIILRSKKILLVDDEKIVLKIGRKLLEKFGCEVSTANDGVAALEYLAGHDTKTDLVVLDLTMPKMDGTTILKNIRNMDRYINVLLTSGYDEDNSREKLGDLQPDGFLKKPFTLDALRNAVTKIFTPDTVP